HGARHGTQTSGESVIDQLPKWAKPVLAVEPWLPPGLVTDSVLRVAESETGLVFESLAGLGVYILAAGVVLGVRLRAEYAGERLSEAPAARRRTEDDSKWLLEGSGPIA